MTTTSGLSIKKSEYFTTVNSTTSSVSQLSNNSKADVICRDLFARDVFISGNLTFSNQLGVNSIVNINTTGINIYRSY